MHPYIGRFGSLCIAAQIERDTIEPLSVSSAMGFFGFQIILSGIFQISLSGFPGIAWYIFVVYEVGTYRYIDGYTIGITDPE